MVVDVLVVVVDVLVVVVDVLVVVVVVARGAVVVAGLVGVVLLVDVGVVVALAVAVVAVVVAGREEVVVGWGSVLCGERLAGTELFSWSSSSAMAPSGLPSLSSSGVVGGLFELPLPVSPMFSWLV